MDIDLKENSELNIGELMEKRKKALDNASSMSDYGTKKKLWEIVDIDHYIIQQLVDQVVDQHSSMLMASAALSTLYGTLLKQEVLDPETYKKVWEEEIIPELKKQGVNFTNPDDDGDGVVSGTPGSESVQ